MIGWSLAGMMVGVLAWPAADPMPNVPVPSVPMPSVPMQGAPPTGDGAPASPDTMAYCLHLASKVEALARLRPPVPPDITQLIEEGRSLCNAGHIRPGIHRERWALKELRGE